MGFSYTQAMDWLIFTGVAVVLLVLGYVAQRQGWIDMTNKARRAGSSSGLIGGLDEAFHPTRHEAQVELDRQTVLPAPSPVAGDGDFGIYDGQVKIDLTNQMDASAGHHAKHRDPSGTEGPDTPGAPRASS